MELPKISAGKPASQTLAKKESCYAFISTSLIMGEVLFIFIDELFTCIIFSVDHIFLVRAHCSVWASVFFIML